MSELVMDLQMDTVLAVFELERGLHEGIELLWLEVEMRGRGRRLVAFAGSAAAFSSFSKHSTIGSRYGRSVSRSTPLQKLIRVAAAWE